MEISTITHHKLYHYQLPCIGYHLALNSLAVVGIGIALENNGNTASDCINIIPKLLRGLQKFSALSGRGAVHFGLDNVVIIDESYNANPDSMKAAINRAQEYKKLYQNQRLILILGDMKELGENAKQMHLELKDVIMEYKVDIVHTIGEMSEGLSMALPNWMRGFSRLNCKDILNIIASVIKPNDIILIKGSNSMGLNAVVKILKERFG